MATNKYQIINNWLLNNYQPLNNWMYFNATPEIVGSTTLNSVAGSNTIREYIDGSKDKELIFAIDMITQYDGQGTSSVNMDAFDEVTNFIDFLSKLQKSNYPVFSSKQEVYKIKVLSDVPDVLVNTQNMLSKYQFQCSIYYIDYSDKEV